MEMIKTMFEIGGWFILMGLIFAVVLWIWVCDMIMHAINYVLKPMKTLGRFTRFFRRR
jgi:hypothetical protein